MTADKRAYETVTQLPPGENVIAMCEWDDRVIVAATCGVYVLAADGLLYPVPFVQWNPEPTDAPDEPGRAPGEDVGA